MAGIPRHLFIDIIAVLCVLTLVYKLTVSEHIFDVPLVELASLTFRFLQYLSFQLADPLLQKLPELYSLWTYVKIVGVVYGVYFLYGLMIRPMNRVRSLGDLGYAPENGLSMKETANMVRKRRLAGDVPPVYPNGWFVVLESRDLNVGESKAVSCLGLQLAVFRGEDGRAHIMDGYCPHMGAHLAVGGQVKGNCLECPFHGWRFNGDDGKCTYIPYTDAKIPDSAKVKSYISLERNNFIHIWHHAEGVEPYWDVPEIPEVQNGEWSFRGRTEHAVNAHIEEVPENGADVAHLAQVHSPFMTSGIDLRYTYSKLWSFLKHNWQGDWTQSEEPGEKHIGTLALKHSLQILGKEFSFLDMEVKAKQIGPGIVYLAFESPFGKGAYVHTLTPTEPLMQRALFHVYFHWTVPTIVGKFYLLSEALQFERDIMIWNNKRFVSKPLFVKSKEDSLIAKHRRWYSQFYSENSPRLKFQKDTLDW